MTDGLLDGAAAAAAADDSAAGRRRLRELVFGFARTQLVYVAAALGIPDLVAAGVDDPAALAAETGADPDALRRLLRGLAAAGVVAEGADGRVALTAAGEALRDGVPGSLRSIALAAGGEWYGVWGALLPSVRSGEVAFERVHGAPLFAWYADHPEAAAAFDQRMVDATTGTAAAVLAAVDFSPFRTLVDLGGGRGQFLAAVLRATPGLRGVLFDLPPLAERARAELAAAGLGARSETVAGDFFADPLPPADAYLLSQILHDWDDDRCAAILRAVRRAIDPGGRLFVVETLLPERVTGPAVAVDHDLLMLTITGGRERTEAEYRALFAAGGFAVERVAPTAAFREAVVLVGAPTGEPAA
jgi:orsellinic acid C2-O-methyltransferase